MRSIRRFLSCCSVLVSAAVLLCAPKLGAYTFLTPFALLENGPAVMDLRLGSASDPLLDGSTSWDAVVGNASAAWNGYINLVQFTKYAASPKAPAAHDGVNQIYWDDTVNG